MEAEQGSPISIMEAMRSQEGTLEVLEHEIVEASGEHAALRMVIKSHMVNGYKIAHGGMIFCFADTAMAYAACATGIQFVTTNTNMNFMKPAVLGDELLATATVAARFETLVTTNVIITIDEAVIATGCATSRLYRPPTNANINSTT